MKVRELLTETNWIQGDFAKTKDGVPTTGGDRRAVCWCLAGAIAACYSHETRHTIFSKVNDCLVDSYHFHAGIYKFNDNFTWKDIDDVIETTGI